MRNPYVSPNAKLTLKRLGFLALVAQGKGASQQQAILGLTRLTISRYNITLSSMGLIEREATGRKRYVPTAEGKQALAHANALLAECSRRRPRV